MRDGLRIAVVAACPFPYPRGTPVRALRLTEAMARRGHEMHVATYHVGEGAVDPDVSVHRIRAPSRIAPLRPGPTPGKLGVLDPLLLATLKRVLARNGPFDIIHAHHYEGLLVALAATGAGRSRTPIVYDAHTMLETELPTYRTPAPRILRAAVGRLLDRSLPGHADHVVAVSSVIRDRLVSAGAVPPDRITPVVNGVERAAFPERSLRADAPPDDGGTVVYAGNLARYHRVDLLLEAFTRVVDRRPRAMLRVLTDSAPDALMDRAEALGLSDHLELRAVPFAALPEALTTAHVAVNPRPVCDGVPQKNLNYMAAGLPLVAFAGSLHPCRDGQTGIAVPAVCPEGLADAILDLLEHPNRAARLGASARDAARRVFSWDSRARRVEDVYHRLIASARSSPAEASTSPRSA